MKLSKGGQNNLETSTLFGLVLYFSQFALIDILLGNKPYIMINTFDKIKETFVRDADTYVNKNIPLSSVLFRGGEHGVIDSNGATWRDHRRFAISKLRDFGLGKNLMQEKILIEVQEIFKRFDASEGPEVEIPPAFDNAVANVINQILFGYRFIGVCILIWDNSILQLISGETR